MQNINHKTENEKGMILITILILMAIITLIGVIAISNSTIDIQISGNTRRASTAFEGAEAGVDLSIPIIENTIASGTLSPTSFNVSGTAATIDGNLGNEILTDQAGTDVVAFDSDISVSNLGGAAVDVDIDRLYSYTIPGGALEFAAGYEGIGSGAAGAGVGVLYSIRSQGEM